jgi:hypothetical protein
MKTSIHPAFITSVLRDLGISATDKPSIDSPIAVNLFYSKNTQGAIRFICPKTDFMAKIHSLLLSLGWGRALAYGKMVLYTDLPTATYLQVKWTNTTLMMTAGNSQ